MVGGRLYPILDTGFLDRDRITGELAAVIAGGADMVQLRDKSGSSREMFALALVCQTIAQEAGIPLIINDRTDIALACGAAGVHLGQQDLPAAAARELMGTNALIGISVGSESEARRAAEAGASYVSVSPVFATGSKVDIDSPKGTEVITRIRAVMAISVYAIGGIHEHNLEAVLAAGAQGISVISAIFGRADTVMRTRLLKTILERNEAGGDDNK